MLCTGWFIYWKFVNEVYRWNNVHVSSVVWVLLNHEILRLPEFLLAHSHSTLILPGSIELLRNILPVHMCLVFMYPIANTYWVASQHKRTYDIFVVDSKMNKTNHVR